MNGKQLIRVNCYLDGGRTAKNKVHSVGVYLRQEEVLVETYPVDATSQLVCKLSFKIGDVEIGKEFRESECPTLTEIKYKLNLIDFDKITSNGVVTLDDSTTILEYLYLNSPNGLKKLVNPDNKEVLSILDDLIRTLIEDKELDKVIKLLEESE